ncbi:unnamed protein product [Brachionus calyciflorus]|uniref:Uncharacterized protein n=1 Tax=Brachionus calyciflorus TaxID=104777 RepID=A0A813MB66_9BILA|nr:unnamed protein product [Brachionus calyciflorus]
MSNSSKLLRSLTKSEQSPVEANVIGEIPKWLNGTLFRNGPGRFKYGDKTYEHLFDGHSCIHKFQIKNGKVFYSNKFLETHSYKKTLKESRLYSVFGTIDVCSNLYERMKLVFQWPETLDNANINLVPYGNDRLFALTETNTMYEIDPSNLCIINRIQIDKYLQQATTTFAHPHILEDGSWITMGMNFKNFPPHYELIEYKKVDDIKVICENAEIIARVPSSHYFGLSYFHSFGLTKNYIVFLEQSIKFDVKNLLTGIFTNKAFSNAFCMLDNFPTRIHVINRNNGQIIQKKFTSEPLVVFHHINTYEVYDLQNNLCEIITDVCAYDPKFFDIKNFTYENMYTESLLGTSAIRSTARRITIPMKNEDYEIYCEAKELNPNVVFELPVINYSRFNGKNYQFMYAANYFTLPFSIVKMNMQNPSEVLEKKYESENGKYLPSEPIFVESPSPKSEDDGILLVMVLSDKKDYLSILDAKNLKEIAKAEIPEDVKGAFTFHGFFAQSDKFKKLNQ